MTEEPTGLVQAEEMSSQEREKTGVYGEMQNWIRNEFRERIKELIPTKEFRKHEAAAKLSRDLACRLYLFVQGRNMQNLEDLRFLDFWNRELEVDLFDVANRDSVVNCRREKWKKEIRESLVGPISGLTLIDLIKSVNPKLSGRLGMSEVITKADVDVRNKVDFVFRFEDTNPMADDREIVRLVQLKSTPDPEKTAVWRIDPENVREEILKHVSHGDIRKMFKKARQLEEYSKKDIDAQVYLIVVPKYGRDSGVGNVFGIIDNLRIRDRAIAHFRKDARVSGFLPAEES